jgi:hypothetical protein
MGAAALFDDVLLLDPDPDELLQVPLLEPELELEVPTTASQPVVPPPPVPAQLQINAIPLLVTVVGVPALQRLVVGATLSVCPFADPHTPPTDVTVPLLLEVLLEEPELLVVPELLPLELVDPPLEPEITPELELEIEPLLELAVMPELEVDVTPELLLVVPLLELVVTPELDVVPELLVVPLLELVVTPELEVELDVVPELELVDEPLLDELVTPELEPLEDVLPELDPDELELPPPEPFCNCWICWMSC